MEENFLTFEQAETALGKDSRWISGNIVGGHLPAGEYTCGAVILKDYRITNPDESVASGKYPVIAVSGTSGQGEITGNQMLGSAIAPVNGGSEPKDYLVKVGDLHRLNSVPINKQFTGSPIRVLINMQGKRIKVTPKTIKVPTEFPKGDERTESRMLEVAGKLAPKQVYQVELLG